MSNYDRWMIAQVFIWIVEIMCNVFDLTDRTVENARKLTKKLEQWGASEPKYNPPIDGRL